jgi:hypothetical protein
MPKEKFFIVRRLLAHIEQYDVFYMVMAIATMVVISSCVNK